MILSPGCFDPLYRKAVRVSMAASLRVPFVQVPDWPDGLAALSGEGFTVVALTPDEMATDIDEFIAAGRPAIVWRCWSVAKATASARRQRLLPTCECGSRWRLGSIHSTWPRQQASRCMVSGIGERDAFCSW